MRYWPWVPVLSAAALEGFAASAGLRGAWGLALALHAASCCAAACLHRCLLEGPAGWSFALLFAGTFFLPGLGALGLAAVALASPQAAGPAEVAVVRTAIPGLPQGAAEMDPSRRAIGEQEARLARLAARRGRDSPMAVARLRRALEDPEEDVRLLAHALLESKSRAAYDRIRVLRRELDAAPPPRRAAIEGQLAQEHWELAWLGLVEGECLDEVLETARRHTLAALGGDARSASLHFLLGRIALRRGATHEAERALLRAGELGMSPQLLAPYLAEAAFLARRFDLVSRRLAGARGGGETVDRIRRYWA